jgi:hypothetical protein
MFSDFLPSELDQEAPTTRRVARSGGLDASGMDFEPRMPASADEKQSGA